MENLQQRAAYITECVVATFERLTQSVAPADPAGKSQHAEVLMPIAERIVMEARSDHRDDILHNMTATGAARYKEVQGALQEADL